MYGKKQPLIRVTKRRRQMRFLDRFPVFPIRPKMTATTEAMLGLTNIGNESEAVERPDPMRTLEVERRPAPIPLTSRLMVIRHCEESHFW